MSTDAGLHPPRLSRPVESSQAGAINPLGGTFVQRMSERLARLGSLIVMTGQVAVRAVSPPYAPSALVYQMEALGVRSLPIALLTATFAGLVISLQFGFFLARFGVQYTVGRVVVLTLFRELSPVLIALTVGARVGSGIAAELGSMTVTEQVDAIRALGADPLRKLVVPRVLACLLLTPALTVLADVIGMLAGALVVNVQYGISFHLFFQGALDVVLMGDFLSGVFKGFVFGGIIGVVGCFKGLTVEGGTEGVGRATTQTVAITSVSVCLADFFITKLTLSL
ncbi:phospholipid/cholesterol/gamma-HCH transport system permease protein [Archangium gephyra]|uniref:ABC transporter permease protein n=2 Tax=Archangium gephyra TaxID=48 RepID=A0AAC8TB68_9BACT|nr:putative ABC transporter permease protein [Archangium gephyra]REG15446.1 phospholipid/cholesterol/gamma-HCH transport system permease protein [Archangium gephyra]